MAGALAAVLAWASGAPSLAVAIAAVIYAPALHGFFGTAALTPGQLATVAPFPFIIWGADEIRCMFLRRGQWRRRPPTSAERLRQCREQPEFDDLRCSARVGAEQAVQEGRCRVEQPGAQGENHCHEVRDSLRIACHHDDEKRYHQQYQQQFNQSTHRLPAYAGLLILRQSYF